MKMEQDLKVLSPNLYTKIYKFLFDLTLGAENTWGMNKIDDFYKKLQDREGKKGAKKKAKIAYFPFKPKRPSTKFPVPWEGV